MNNPRLERMLISTPLQLGDVRSLQNQHIDPSPIMPIHSSTLNDSEVTNINLWNLKVSPDIPTSCTTSPSEFYKNHQASLQRTPLKNASCAKLGSPERNGLISGRKPTQPKFCITPKIERCSPVKKRLFGLQSQTIGNRRSLLAAHTKHDPVVYFTRKTNVRHVLKNIFGALNDRDLYNCRRVSSSWRDAVNGFKELKETALKFESKVVSNKENPGKLKSLQCDKMEVQGSTTFGDKFIELGQTLKKNQTLTKCAHCENPQIVEHNIGQCLSCGYICCFQCNSFSHNGPDYFEDKCNSSLLVIPKNHIALKRRTLMDSPPHSQQPSFLSTSSTFSNLSGRSLSLADNSHLYANNTSKDSCYWSYEDVNSKSSLYSADTSTLSRSLSISNGQRSNKRNLDRHSTHFDELKVKRQEYTSLYTPVVRIRKSPRKESVVEDSPEKKIDCTPYRGVGTTASKKRLRRLLR